MDILKILENLNQESCQLDFDTNCPEFLGDGVCDTLFEPDCATEFDVEDSRTDLIYTDLNCEDQECLFTEPEVTEEICLAESEGSYAEESISASESDAPIEQMYDPQTNQQGWEDEMFYMDRLASLSSNTSEPLPFFTQLRDQFDTFVNFIVGGHPSNNKLLRPDHFSECGTIDLRNNLQVIGDVRSDIQFVDRQTGQSCSLMAQEQFVHRYAGRAVPEDYLEWFGKQQGVYCPEVGTYSPGWSMVLDHFDIPHKRYRFNFFNTTSKIDNYLVNDVDILTGVDARAFYQDNRYPPGSGHAVAIVGKGINPDTGSVEGYYFTDSNFPGTSRFLTVKEFESAWSRDIIAVPNPPGWSV